VPGRIHCSEACANVLRQSGKGKWLYPREEIIVAKGKGEMKTFWVHPSHVAQTISGDTSDSNPREFAASGASETTPGSPNSENNAGTQGGITIGENFYEITGTVEA